MLFNLGASWGLVPRYPSFVESPLVEVPEPYSREAVEWNPNLIRFARERASYPRGEKARNGFLGRMKKIDLLSTWAGEL